MREISSRILPRFMTTIETLVAETLALLNGLERCATSRYSKVDLESDSLASDWCALVHLECSQED